MASFNAALKDRLLSFGDVEDEMMTTNKSQTIKSLRKQYREDIERTYDEDDLPKVFAILYEQTYFESRERMGRWNRPPYAFAWEIGFDFLTRIIADGKAKRKGSGIAATVARGKERSSFGRGRR